MTLDVVYDLPAGDVDALQGLYRNTWYGADRRRDALDRMLAETDAMVALYDHGDHEGSERDDGGDDGVGRDDGDLVAFGHAITDGSFVAVLRDLVVAADARDEGVGRRLVEELLAHPELSGIDRLTVVCPERLAGFYEACGFSRRDDGIVLNRDGDA